MRPPPPLRPARACRSCSAMTRTPKRKSGCTSCAILPSLVATRISRTSSAKRASTLIDARIVARAPPGSRARAARASRGRRPSSVSRVELVAVGQRRRRELDATAAAPAARDLRRGLGRALHRVPGEVLDVGVAGRVAPLHAHAEPHRDAARRAARDAFVEARGRRPRGTRRTGRRSRRRERARSEQLVGRCPRRFRSGRRGQRGRGSVARRRHELPGDDEASRPSCKGKPRTLVASPAMNGRTCYWAILVALHVTANVVWIGSILAVGRVLAATRRRREGPRRARRAHLQALAVPAFIASFLAGAARLVAGRRVLLRETHFMHAKLLLALVVIGLHHVIGARAKKAAAGSAAGRAGARAGACRRGRPAPSFWR